MPPQRRASRRRFPSAAQGRRSRWSCGLQSVSRVSWPLRVGVTRRAKCLRPSMAGSRRGSTPGTSGTRGSCSISCQQHHPERGMRPVGRPLPPRPWHALPAHRRSSECRAAPDNRSHDVPRDGHDLLAGAGGGGAGWSRAMTQVVSVVTILAVALVAPLVGEAQLARIFRVGYLGGTPPQWDGFIRGLREQGYTEKLKLAIEYRSAEGRNENYPALAAELVRLNRDVIVAHSAPAALAAKQARTTIPIVLLNVADSVGVGLVASLARPGGNVTGVSSQAADFTAKLLELAKQAVPRLDRVAVITTLTNPSLAPRVRDLEAAASALGITLDSFGVGRPPEIQQAFPAMTQRGTDAIVVVADNLIWFHRAQILDLATRSHLPTICMFKVWADAGCFLADGPSLAHMWYQAGVFAGKLLNGAKPADLPVEQPTKFELVINLKTAKALGLAIPRTLLARVDEVIE